MAGFSWGESSAGLTLDIAYPSNLMMDSFYLASFWEDGDQSVTNTNKRFIFGGSKRFDPGLGGDETGRRLWATYEFSLDWQPGDSIVIDTLSFNDQSEWAFSLDVPRVKVLPHWTGRYVFKASTDVTEIPGDLPGTFTLGQNYPNPFNPTTEIVFEIPRRSWITLKVFNVLGQVVETLVNEELSANRYVATWDGSGVSSGVYFYRLEADDFMETRKMILVK